MGYKIIVTGATGMVGKAALLECLDAVEVDEVLSISRRSVAMEHPKLREILHADFADFSALSEQVRGYDACFYCMGVSSLGMSEARYTTVTYDYALSFARVFHQANPNAVFNYVSGTGTDSSEKGSRMWARVKGKTENDLFALGFADAYAIRANAIYPRRGVRSNAAWINAIYWLSGPVLPLLKRLTPIIDSDELGWALLATLKYPQANKHLENPDLMALSQRWKS